MSNQSPTHAPIYGEKICRSRRSLKRRSAGNVPAGKRDEKLREGQMNKSLSLATAQQGSHARVERKEGLSIRGNLKSIEILAGILATPFLFWFAFLGVIGMIVGWSELCLEQGE